MALQDLELARIGLDETLDRLKRSAIRAPFPGQVVERLRQPGEAVGQGTEVVHLVNVARPEIRARVSPDAVLHLTPDTLLPSPSPVAPPKAACAPSSPSATTAPASSKSASTSPKTSPPHPSSAPPSASKYPKAPPAPPSPSPRDALVLRSGRSWVFRVQGNTAERRAVETGTARGDRVEILSGIEAGDRVVVRGAERLVDGQQVVESSS